MQGGGGGRERRKTPNANRVSSVEFKEYTRDMFLKYLSARRARALLSNILLNLLLPLLSKGIDLGSAPRCHQSIRFFFSPACISLSLSSLFRYFSDSLLTARKNFNLLNILLQPAIVRVPSDTRFRYPDDDTVALLAFCLRYYSYSYLARCELALRGNLKKSASNLND